MHRKLKPATQFFDLFVELSELRLLLILGGLDFNRLCPVGIPAMQWKYDTKPRGKQGYQLVGHVNQPSAQTPNGRSDERQDGDPPPYDSKVIDSTYLSVVNDSSSFH